MNRMFLIFLIFTCYAFIGCATQKPMYNWGDYSHSLYSYKQMPDAENIHKHKQVLYEIIEESNSKGLRVPPGVYCEYGYIFMKEGNNKEALRYFELEEQTYPESKVFIQTLKTRIE